MVGISKEDVLNWYQGLNASHRVEIMCALLDHSLPFELRFLGSVIENLGRKDFHVLRDAECRANSLHSSESMDQAAILKLLSESPTPMPMTLNSQVVSNTANHHGIVNTNSHSNNATEHPAAATRSSQTTQEKKATDRRKVHSESSQTIENGLSSKSSTPGSSSSESGCKESDKCNAASNHVELNSEEENDSKKDTWLHDWTKRRKLILYLSLMAATNHDSANLYYILLSDVEDLMESLGWLEELEEMVQDEILLLYTIGSHHPAFTFEQRTFLSAVLNRFKDCMARYSKPCGQNFQNPNPLNQILNHHYLPPISFTTKYLYKMQTSTAPVHSGTSISVNTPLLSYGHPQPPNSQGGHSYYTHYYATCPTVGVTFGAPGTFRPPNNAPQAPLLNQPLNPPPINPPPAAFIQSPHPNSLINNQMVMKQQQDQRNHTGGHVSLRQKNPSVVQQNPNYLPGAPDGFDGSTLLSIIQNQDTPTRRANNNNSNNTTSIPPFPLPPYPLPSACTGLTNPPTSLPLPSHSPVSSRSRGVILEVGGGGPMQSGADFPWLNSLENNIIPALDEPIEINNRPRKISCYNCGSNGHLGPECKEASMEEMTRKQYRLNYGGPPSETKEGD